MDAPAYLDFEFSRAAEYASIGRVCRGCSFNWEINFQTRGMDLNDWAFLKSLELTALNNNDSIQTDHYPGIEPDTTENSVVDANRQ